MNRKYKSATQRKLNIYSIARFKKNIKYVLLKKSYAYIRVSNDQQPLQLPMKSLVIKRFILVLFVFYTITAFGQNADTADISANQQLAAISTYQSFVKPSTNLYSGPQYIEYAYSIPEGTPMLNDDFVEGTIFYNGILYSNLPMQYDLMKELVIVKDPMKVYKFTLFSQNVKWFTLANHKFERIENNDSGNAIIATGFYDVLYDGKTSIYKKENLSIKETIT